MDMVLDINIKDIFPHLNKAPIVEAVIAIGALPTSQFDEKFVRNHIENKLDGYEFKDSIHEFIQDIQIRPQASPENKIHDLGWKGLHYRSNDGLNVVQINRDGFVFSRLQPYESWKQLSSEAHRLWNEYNKIAKPVAINRLGLRFINRFNLPPKELEISKYIDPAPEPPRGLELPFLAFMHQDRLAVPGHDYAINLIRTIQKPSEKNNACVGIIIDIDVFTLRTQIEVDDDIFDKQLMEMRWLKNKVFFGSITDEAKEDFK